MGSSWHHNLVKNSINFKIPLTSPDEVCKISSCHTASFDLWMILFLSQTSPLTSMSLVIINENTICNNLSLCHWWQHHQTLMLIDVNKPSLDMHQTPPVMALRTPHIWLWRWFIISFLVFVNAYIFSSNLPIAFSQIQCLYLYQCMDSLILPKVNVCLCINVCILSSFDINGKGTWSSIIMCEPNPVESLWLSFSIYHICQCFRKCLSLFNKSFLNVIESPPMSMFPMLHLFLNFHVDLTKNPPETMLLYWQNLPLRPCCFLL